MHPILSIHVALSSVVFLYVDLVEDKVVFWAGQCEDHFKGLWKNCHLICDINKNLSLNLVKIINEDFLVQNPIQQHLNTETGVLGLLPLLQQSRLASQYAA